MSPVASGTLLWQHEQTIIVCMPFAFYFSSIAQPTESSDSPRCSLAPTPRLSLTGGLKHCHSLTLRTVTINFLCWPQDLALTQTKVPQRLLSPTDSKPRPHPGYTNYLQIYLQENLFKATRVFCLKDVLKQFSKYGNEKSTAQITEALVVFNPLFSSGCVHR